ncbi:MULTISPECIES: TetR/AcrR family transcriptional regulator [unclassified Acinetobacter]|uniref:TetR/AcrR family transcriptional regulator n=1 Tax=unclassified Acinetobacter TaxID=196816 RepID=UPI0035B99B84
MNNVREKIIKNSFTLFYQYGFHACGVEMLARHAGTTKRTLYAHFTNKDGLILAVLDYRHQQFLEQLQEALQRYEVEETAKAYLSFIQAWTQSDDFYGCMFINACAEFSESDCLIFKKAQAHKSQIRAILTQRFQQLNYIQADKPADILFSFGEGLIVSAQTAQTNLNFSIENIAKIIHELK